MNESFGRIIANILKSIYQPFFFALILSVLVLFFVMYLDNYKECGLKEKLLKAMKDLKERFTLKPKYRRVFYLTFFVVMLLFKTLLNRDMWMNPLSSVMGVWGLYDKDGVFTTEAIENVVLFIPLIYFILYLLEATTKKVSRFIPVMGRAVLYGFLFSFTIEMLQLLLRLGTWQLSDLCYNTLGGVIGGLVYWISAKIRKI